MLRDDVLPEVLRRFSSAEPELDNGFAEHAPMGAEAMLSLGIDPQVVLDWSQRHAPSPPRPSSRHAAVRSAIAAELELDDWSEVLVRHCVPLVPRLDVHLFHGLIRTAHAARAIAASESDAARSELAAGLAAWTVWAGDVEPAPAAPASSDPLGEVVEMARRGAVAFTERPSIVTIHATTAPMAYVLLAEHLDTTSHAIAAAVFSRTHRRHPLPPARPTSDRFPGTGELEALALRWDAHPAKLVEAASRGYALTGDAAFVEAAVAMMG